MLSNEQALWKEGTNHDKSLSVKCENGAQLVRRSFVYGVFQVESGHYVRLPPSVVFWKVRQVSLLHWFFTVVRKRGTCMYETAWLCLDVLCRGSHQTAESEDSQGTILSG